MNNSKTCPLISSQELLTDTLNNVTVIEHTIKISPHMVAVFCLVYGAVFLISVVGNLGVLTVIFRNRRLQSVTYIYIANLALADLLVTFTVLPITLLVNIYFGWMFGAFMCKAVPYLQGVSVCASVNTLVVIAVDRYMAICHVMRRRNTKRMARFILFIIWVISFLIIMPWALYYEHGYVVIDGKAIPYCMECFPSSDTSKGFFLGIIFLMCYCLPMALIAVFYFMIGYRVWNRDAPGITSSKGVIEKSKIKVVKMLVVVVLLFMISWMPLYIIKLVGDYSSRNEYVSMYINPFAQWLGTSNSCMNPLVYCFFSQKIRRRIWTMLCCSKPEPRSMFSSRSTMHSAFQHSVQLRDSSLRLDACSNGHETATYGQKQGGCSSRTRQQGSDLIRLTRNNKMSTHV